MSDYQQNPLWLLLDEIEHNMQILQLWQEIPPPASAFESQLPFFLDTLSAENWLQWVLLPRLRALMVENAELPKNAALTPYFEEIFKTQIDQYKPLLQLLAELDRLLAE